MTTSDGPLDSVVERLCLVLSADLVSNGFLRGTFRSTLDTLLALAISQANLAAMDSDLVFQRTYASLNASPPDALRRPVRVRPLALSLGIPLETARRRIGLMVKDGVLVQTDAGVFIPKSVTETPAYLATAKGTWRALGDLYGALRQEGALAPPLHANPDGEIPYRYMMRLWGRHFLRLIEALLPMLHEPFDIVLLFAILGAGQAEQAGAAGPVSASSLARKLGIPFETLRRNALRLVEKGLCQKAQRGYQITAELLETPAWRRFAESHRQVLTRFFSIMSERDMLGWWEADFRAANPLWIDPVEP
jgi:hypothetical protein